MSEEIGRLRAALVARMRELPAPINDPRLAEMLVQLQALVQQHTATAANAGVTMLRAQSAVQPPTSQDGPSAKLISELPQRLKELTGGYIAFARTQRVHMFAQAPALSESDAGRGLMQLDAVD